MDHIDHTENPNVLKRGVFTKILLGDFGLPITFWLFGVLPGTVISYLTDLIVGSASWMWLTLATIALVQACIIPIAVWNAANKYKGNKLWAILAKIIAALSAFKWLIDLPKYISAYFMVIKFTYFFA